MSDLFTNAQVTNGGSVSVYGTVRMQELGEQEPSEVHFEVYSDALSNLFRDKSTHVRFENGQMVVFDRTGSVRAALCPTMFSLVGRYELCEVSETGSLRRIIRVRHDLRVPEVRGGWMLSRHSAPDLVVDTRFAGRTVLLLTLCQDGEEVYRVFDQDVLPAQLPVKASRPVGRGCLVG